ncbi:MAG: fibronectin type III domain-containing protein [Thermoanaerobaculia bacterium]
MTKPPEPAWIVSIALVCAIAGACASAAATYVAMEDRDLLAEADIVAEVTIARKLEPMSGGRPSTDHLALVGKVLKGRLDSSSVVVRTLGGPAPAGGELVIPGAPRLSEGDRLLLFLTANPDGSYTPIHLGLGVFRREVRGGLEIAARSLERSTLLDQNLVPITDPARDYERFLGWLSTADSAPDYFLDLPPAGSAKSLPYVSAFNLLTSGGHNVRWFEFDDGGSVDWLVRPEGSGGTLPRFEASLAVWSRAPVSFRVVGETDSTVGFDAVDGLNTIVFGDPEKQVGGSFDCIQGGILAAAGWRTTGTTGSFQGETFIRLAEADIVVNEGFECLFDTEPSAVGEVYTHELGHTLGIGHSCGDGTSGPCDDPAEDDATMRSSPHRDGRGAAIRSDDIAALVALYGGSSANPDGATPGDLEIERTSETSARLTWSDNSEDESAFQIWRRVGDRAFKLWRSVGAGVTELDFSGAKPGKTYSFKVRAVIGDPEDTVFSDFSNTAVLAVPSSFKRPKKLRATALDSTSGRLTWKDRSDGERRFRIERRVGSGAWKSWRSVPANTTSIDFDDGEPGTSYRFRLQARKGGDRSKYSNVARLTMPQ